MINSFISEGDNPDFGSMKEGTNPYDLMFKASPVGMAFIGLSGENPNRVITANGAFAKTFGYDEEEVLGMDVLSLVPEGGVGPVKDSLTKISEGKDYETNTLRVLSRKDGSTFPAEIDIFLVRDADEKPLFMTATVQDVSEKFRMAHELAENQEMYQSFTASTFDGIVIVDDGDGMIYVNPAMSEIFGYEYHEMLGRGLGMLIPEDQRTAHNEAFREYLKTGKKTVNWKRVEYRGLAKDGSMPYLRISFTEFEVGDRKVFAGTIRDITEFKLAEDRLADFIKKTPDGVIMTSWDGEIISMNPAGVRMLGYDDFDEMRNKSTGELYGKQGNVRREFRRILETEGVVDDFSAQLRKKDGSIIPCTITATVQKDQGDKPIGYIGIIKDMTQAELARELELSLAKIEADRQSRKETALNILHNVGNPISGAMVNVELVLKALEVGQIERVKSYAESSKKKLLEVKRFFERLKAVMALEEGVMEFNFQEMTVPLLAALIRNAAEEQKALFDEKGLEFFLEKEEISDPELKVAVDVDMVKEVIENLLSNAFKYTREGRVSLAVSCIGEELVVTCKDDGLGIPPDQLEKVFNMGFRASNTEGVPGSGLGLPFVKGVVDAHGGKVEVKSEVGRGSSFTVKLPLVKKQQSI